MLRGRRVDHGVVWRQPFPNFFKNATITTDIDRHRKLHETSQLWLAFGIVTAVTSPRLASVAVTDAPIARFLAGAAFVLACNEHLGND